MVRRKFTPEFKLEAVGLVKERGEAVRQAPARFAVYRMRVQFDLRRTAS